MNTANYMTKLTGYECQQIELPPFATNQVLSLRNKDFPLYTFSIEDSTVIGVSLKEKEAIIIPRLLDAEYIYCHDKNGGTFYKFDKLGKVKPCQQ